MICSRRAKRQRPLNAIISVGAFIAATEDYKALGPANTAPKSDAPASKRG